MKEIIMFRHKNEVNESVKKYLRAMRTYSNSLHCKTVQKANASIQIFAVAKKMPIRVYGTDPQ